MFNSLSERLSKALQSMGKKARLTEESISGTLRDVRKALLEADVALPVVKQFVSQVRARALGKEVRSSLTPGQQFLKVVQSELEMMLGGSSESLDLAQRPPAVVLLVGLQGSGKTTTAAKLAKFLSIRQKKRVLMVSVDVYRPAAMEQLSALGQQIDVDVFPSSPDQSPIELAEHAKVSASSRAYDVLIVDTAGRMGVDEAMMSEISQLNEVLDPIETLFVVDAMTGQDAANTAKAFVDVLPLTGVILTKVDGDARGGAALSVKAITGQPIKFMGVGETVDGLEAFHPDRLASRILGMGDIIGLIEEAEQKIDRVTAEKIAKKVMKGKGFDLADFRDQLQQMRSMGGMKAMLEKMPGMGNASAQMQSQVDDKQFVRMEAVINSMTPAERHTPEILGGSRKNRIAAGSGTNVQEVNKVIKQHKQMSKMMKKVSKKGGMQSMMRGISGMMPPGGMPRL
ncbi:signal recognition particle protein [Litorivicinus sp.]|nr:signal recognition particle protein [Litorivicinus sp.]MDC1208412.1 signal recognition particle protein [Litorivicinus sp.]MDC1466618.1 signal recognition particle protein [Litorivicinus sp.]